ncbi:antibiotic biosynthesis monooxygenase [uncultured Roseibium sp.]|uniref:putative quinol monooxygenase n=1 Tax=uncultured Roseibium sp. TaxID=1936171 RepID=UPI002603DB51|nr:antibiotic biosynthesis monooxygenase [uncultured Roseibium sp.]
MASNKTQQGPILRLFQVRVKDGSVDSLLAKFATTSADVVRNEPGNKGYFFGREVSVQENRLIFASLWSDMKSVKQRFGDQWDQSFLPEGYGDMIEDHSIQHIDLSSGWCLPPAEQD